MIIPSGWIHAVYTPSDSLVLGGNFLTPIHIPSQLHIANIETRTRVPKKFRFPFFDLAMWYTAQYYLDQPRKPESMSVFEVSGLRELAEWAWKKAKLRQQQLAKGTEYHRAKVEAPPGWDTLDVATRFVKFVYESEDVDADVPTWVRNEVLLVKNETPSRKRRRGEETPTPRKYTRRTSKKDAELAVVDVVMTDVSIPQQERPIEYASLSRPVTSYSTILSAPITQYPNITYPLPHHPLTTTLSHPGPPLNIFKPYSSTTPTTLLHPKAPSFIDIIKSTYRPYLSRPLLLLEEIKVEDEPQLLGTGLEVLSLAIDLSTKLPPPSPASTLTVYSPSD